MGLFRRRRRSQSTGSVTTAPLLGDTDDDRLYLPGSDQVYLTLTRSGKPALARKKSDDLLRHHGFDILGETFGIPSRRTFDHQLRRPSLKSQSSGVTTAPGTPRRDECGEGKLMFAYDGIESPTSPTFAPNRPSSTPALRHTDPPEIGRHQGTNYPPRPYPTTTAFDPSGPSDNMSMHDTQYPTQPYLPSQTPSLPPPPPLPAVINWHGQPMIPRAQYQYSLPHHVPAYAIPDTVQHHGPPIWNVMRQQPMPAQNSQYPLLSTTQIEPPTIPPGTPYHPWPLCAPAGIHVHGSRGANMIPLPPPFLLHYPPPPPAWLRAPAPVREDGPRNAVENFTTIETGAPSDHPPKEVTPSNNKRKTDQQEKQELSKRLRQVHVCTKCGKKRLRHYQKTQPLRKGELHEPDCCLRCLQFARVADSEDPDKEDLASPSARKTPKVMDQSNCEVDNTPAPKNSNLKVKKTSDASSRMKHFKRLGPFSRLLLRRFGARIRASSPLETISSCGESRCRTPSPSHEYMATRYSPRDHRCSSPDEKTPAEGRTAMMPDPMAASNPSEKTQSRDGIRSNLDSVRASISRPVKDAEGPLSQTNRQTSDAGASPQKSRLPDRPCRYPGGQQRTIPQSHHHRPSALRRTAVNTAVTTSKATHVTSDLRVLHSSDTDYADAEYVENPLSKREHRSRRDETVPRFRKQPRPYGDNSIAETRKLCTESPVRISRCQRECEMQHGSSERKKTRGSTKPRSSSSRTNPVLRRKPSHGGTNTDKAKGASRPTSDLGGEESQQTGRREREKRRPHARKSREQPTPRNARYPEHLSGNSSPRSQSELEQGAEEITAQDDLAAASRIFASSLDGTPGLFNTATSRSSMSIVSCESDVVRVPDSPIAQESSELEPEPEVKEDRMKQLEFGSEVDRHDKASPPERACSSEPGGVRSPAQKRAALSSANVRFEDGVKDVIDDDSYSVPSLAGSSVVAHTGHSCEVLPGET